jgi:hypothetical protein
MTLTTPSGATITLRDGMEYAGQILHTRMTPGALAALGLKPYNPPPPEPAKPATEADLAAQAEAVASLDRQRPDALLARIEQLEKRLDAAGIKALAIAAPAR